MNNIIDLQTHRKAPEVIAHGAWLQHQTAILATRIIDDTDHTSLAEDPIWFFDTHNTTAICDELQLLSMSTRWYIRAYMICIQYMPNFEDRVWDLFMTYWNKKEKLIISLIYLINYPKIEVLLYSVLIAIVSNCTPNEALSAKNTMTRIGIIWSDNTRDDPIFAQFLTKANYAEHGLRVVTAI